ncbi:ferredoxin-thioredoxin reductase catalytic domain-containing protein [Acidobacteriota bacterium]
MKKYWRCHVCNDIHYGLNPPVKCPTCMVDHAYVEVSAKEAHQVMESAETEMDRASFIAAINEFAENNIFQVNTDTERVDMLLEGLFNNENNHGLKYCPCRLATKDFAEDLKLVCPCNFRIHETYNDKKNGECWCGLFVRRK